MFDRQSPFLSQGPTDLVAIAEEKIRHEIKAGGFSPGERLSEQALCKSYKLGRGIVRAALSRLSHKGFVSSQPRSGWRVASITAIGLREITLGKAQLEPLLADVDLLPDDFGRLEALCDMQAALSSGAGPYGEQLELTRNYERQIRDLLASRLKAPLIAGWLEILWDRSDYYLNFLEASAGTQLKPTDWTVFISAKRGGRNKDAARLVSGACDAFAAFTQACLLKSELASPGGGKKKLKTTSNDEIPLARSDRERPSLKKDL
ncbi:GntR family transcriptional regulator [Rhizobium sp. BK602]|uniref:GntR family transcriptional regulator n=1 Tax=Rhizobium sp. BK602 TaxID=2586986 RepID=UPI00161FFD4B|nr:GntR family transcriptional regulator [Rhizobium sp. BK602]MBB3610572.1 DNA-binding GntR family transcriptional regulator [Rhizobium sp. BK602]